MPLNSQQAVQEMFTNNYNPWKVTTAFVSCP